MNIFAIIVLFCSLSFFCYSQNKNVEVIVEEPKSLNFSDSSFSSLTFYPSGYQTINANYEIIFININSEFNQYILKILKKDVFHYSVDGSNPTLLIELYSFSRTNEVKSFKSFELSEDYIEIASGNKIIYKTKTDSRGGGEAVYKLVDIEDHIPFAVYNKKNQCYQLVSGKSIRWISYYTNSHTGINQWQFDRNHFIDLDDKNRLKKIGTIIYSNEEYMFEVIEVYQPYNPGSYPTVDRSNKIIVRTENYSLDDYPCENILTWHLDDENEGFKNITVDYMIDGIIYSLPVEGDNINLEKLNIPNTTFYKRNYN